MKRKNGKTVQKMEYEKLTKTIKEAFKNAAEYTKKDLQNTSRLNFKAC